MKQATRYKTAWRTRLRELQTGFTLVSTVISFTLGSVALVGGWVAFRDIQMQMRVAAAERAMDMFAHNTMAELVNVLSWSLGTEQVAGGRNPRWKFGMMEMVHEHPAPHGVGMLSYRYPTDRSYLLRNVNGGVFELSHRDNKGILIDRDAPGWAGGGRGNRDWYIWDGRRNRGGDEQSTMDRRDRMRMVGFEVERPLVLKLTGGENNKNVHSVAEITITMQYRYDAADSDVRGLATLFPTDYIRERQYSTKVFLRNWDVEENLFLEDLP